jgi:hypothetical protein
MRQAREKKEQKGKEKQRVYFLPLYELLCII